LEWTLVLLGFFFRIKGYIIINVKYLKDGPEYLDFEVRTELAGFISILKEVSMFR